jgi:predicted phosphodiesterase
LNIVAVNQPNRFRPTRPISRNLGDVSCAILAFGGPYSNLQALEAMRSHAVALAIPLERCFCTGDVVAYGADPAMSIDLIRDWGVNVIAGNCELALADAAFDCGCGFQAGSACDIDAARWYAFARRATDDAARAWMASLPGAILFRMAERRAMVVHGSFTRVNRFIFPSTSAAEKIGDARLAEADLVIAGHSGLPFTENLAGGTIWHNPGAIGMPANDGTPDGWYALLNPEVDGRLVITHHRLPYDFAEAARRMRAACLSEGYAHALETGLWPSDDILPLIERAASGQPIDAAGFGYTTELAAALIG